ncbi:MAG TPA: DoxX family protein [Gemmatimonadaceae bacterium]|nr:DoxX family protein [Gemmatimonadaceae bacterium]
MSTNLDDTGKLLLRIAVGGLLLMHGVYKVQNGIGFVTDSVVRNGLPAFFAYGVYVGEVVAPVLVLMGLLTRAAGLVIAFDMIGAIFLARSAEIGTTRPGGAWAIEAEMLFLLGGLAIACLGGGKFALGTGRLR